MRKFLTELSVESSYRRFFTGLGRIPDRFVRQLVDVDHARREALVVVAGEAVVALADYALLAGCPWTAELGVVVADAWQRQGLGQQLVGHLLALAHSRGVRQLRAYTLAENARVARLLRRRWPTARPEREETLLVWHLPLDAPLPFPGIGTERRSATCPDHAPGGRLGVGAAGPA